MSTIEKVHRILLLNFSEDDAQVLKRAKFNVERGFLGAVKPTSSPGEYRLPYYFSRPLYEYEISVYNSCFQAEEMERDFPEAKDIAPDDLMLQAFLEWRTRPHVRIAFTGRDQGMKTLFPAGLPFLSLSAAHEGVSVLEEYRPIEGFNIAEMTKLVSGLRKKVRFPVEQYFERNKNYSSYDHMLYHMPVVYNRNGDQIAAYGTRYEGKTLPVYVVLPQIENNATALVELFEQIARLWPEIFPDREIRDWYNSDEFAFKEQTLITRDIEARVKETMDFIEAKRAEKEEIGRRFGFIKEILIAREDATIDPVNRLSANVRKVFEFLGFTVDDIDAKIKGVIRKEDFWVRDGEEFLAITEVTGVNAKNPKTKEFNDLLGRMATIFKRRDLVPDASTITGLLIVNYDIDTHPAKRPRLYGGEATEIVEAAKENGIGLLPTQELYKIAIAVKDGIITREDARALVKRPGRIEFEAERIPPTNAIGTSQR